jgi:lipopolysaccharide transport system permease protein
MGPRSDRLRNLVYARDLLRELVARDMKLRYKRSALGIAWSLLNPLAQLLVFAFVFGVVLPLKIANYPLFLFIGIIVWTWFQTSLYQASSSIVDNGNLVKQPGFPPAILPVVTVTTQLVHFLLALLVLLPFLAATGSRTSAALLVLPVLIAIQFLVCLGFAFLLATFHVTFRDTQYTLGLILMLGFYLTPVFYDSGTVPERYRPYYRLNPLVHLIDSFRAVLMRGEILDPVPLAVLAALSGILLCIGYAVFVRASDHFVEEL